MQPSLGVCCVIGSDGWLGVSLVKQLAEYECVAKPLRTFDVGADPRNALPDGAIYNKLDIRNAEETRKAIEGADTVFLLASVIDLRLQPDKLCEETNITGCSNVIAACKSAGVHRLVYTSSSTVVGPFCSNAKESSPYLEKGFPWPSGGYYHTKARAEQMILAADAGKTSTGLASIALRFSYIYGTGDPFTPYNVNVKIASTLISMTYIENAAWAHVLAAKALTNDADTVRGRPFFISDFEANPSYILAEIKQELHLCIPFFVFALIMIMVEIIAATAHYFLCRLRVPWNRTSKPIVGLHTLVVYSHTCDASPAQRDLHYVPLVSRADAIERTRHWINKGKNTSKRNV